MFGCTAPLPVPATARDHCAMTECVHRSGYNIWFSETEPKQSMLGRWCPRKVRTPHSCSNGHNFGRPFPQFVADGVFYAELNELLTRELAEDGYAGVEVRKTPMRTEVTTFARSCDPLARAPLALIFAPVTLIFRPPSAPQIIIRATRTQNVLGEKGRRIRELTAVVQKRFNFQPGTVDLYAERVSNRGLCAIAQCESLRYKLLGGLAVRRAAYGVLRFVMESGAKGAEVIISGKLRAQRAKAMKFKDGYMISTGQPKVTPPPARPSPRPSTTRPSIR